MFCDICYIIENCSSSSCSSDPLRAVSITSPHCWSLVKTVEKGEGLSDCWSHTQRLVDGQYGNPTSRSHHPISIVPQRWNFPQTLHVIRSGPWPIHLQSLGCLSIAYPFFLERTNHRQVHVSSTMKSETHHEHPFFFR